MTTRPHDWEAPVALPEVPTPIRVLVPFDGSHNGERALGHAARLAEAAAAEIIVMVGFEQPLTLRGRGAEYIESLRTELADEAADLAREAVQLLIGRGCRARGIVVKGEIARAILDTAEDERVDLIVMGRRGLSAELSGLHGAIDRLQRAIQGGVAHKVLEHARVPVLVVV